MVTWGGHYGHLDGHYGCLAGADVQQSDQLAQASQLQASKSSTQTDIAKDDHEAMLVGDHGDGDEEEMEGEKEEEEKDEGVQKTDFSNEREQKAKVGNRWALFLVYTPLVHSKLPCPQGVHSIVTFPVHKVSIQ